MDNESSILGTARSRRFANGSQCQSGGDVIVRVGAARVMPSANSPSVLGSLGSFHASNDTQMGLTLGYMWTDNFGMELLAATPFKHKIGLRSTGNIASVRELPQR